MLTNPKLSEFKTSGEKIILKRLQNFLEMLAKSAKQKKTLFSLESAQQISFANKIQFNAGGGVLFGLPNDAFQNGGSCHSVGCIIFLRILRLHRINLGLPGELISSRGIVKMPEFGLRLRWDDAT